MFVNEDSATAIWLVALIAARSKLRGSAFAGAALMEAKIIPTNTRISLGIIGASEVMVPSTTFVAPTSFAVLVEVEQPSSNY